MSSEGLGPMTPGRFWLARTGQQNRSRSRDPADARASTQQGPMAATKTAALAELKRAVFDSHPPALVERLMRKAENDERCRGKSMRTMRERAKSILGSPAFGRNQRRREGLLCPRGFSLLKPPDEVQASKRRFGFRLFSQSLVSSNAFPKPLTP